MRRMSGWNFGQVTAVIAELARNLPMFLQANSETSASDKTRRFIHKSSRVPWYENRVIAWVNSGIGVRFWMSTFPPLIEAIITLICIWCLFSSNVYINVMFNLRNKSALIARFTIFVKNYKTNWVEISRMHWIKKCTQFSGNLKKSRSRRLLD